jgi:hypothetical protein
VAKPCPTLQVEFDAAARDLGRCALHAVGAEERHVRHPGALGVVEERRDVPGEIGPQNRGDQVDALDVLERGGIGVAVAPVEVGVRARSCGGADRQAAVDEVRRHAAAGLTGRA